MIDSATLLVDKLRAAGQTVGTCESLTAGLIAAGIADVPGASDVLRGGLVTYSDEVKTCLAQVPAELIDVHGAVSSQVAEAMATGARAALQVDWAVGITGVAGPDPVDGNPVGTVWLAIAGPNGVHSVERVLPEGHTRWALREGAPEPEEVMDGNRAEIRAASAEYALQRLLDAVSA
ncbi:CinA family protein [Staphylococcus chromogenes]|nr:CinA family protein [Staphylococcus chromogenes]